MRRLTPFEFIKEAKVVHGDRYDYSKIKYVYSTEKVTIICKIHGEFEQKPYSHLKEHGCPSCGGTKKISTSEFIEKAKIIHGDKYKYDKVKYINNHTKVTITCPLHGDFTQTPDSHLQKSGCIACSGLKKSTTEEFIKRAREIHGNRYNYDKVKYINNITKVIITCSLHGDFEQTPSAHINKQGCPFCGGSNKLSTEEFIKRAREIHGNRYNYDKVKYINSHTKVIISCPVHGDFKQTPNSHLQNKGCPSCGGTKKISTSEFIEKAKIIHGDKYKYDKVKYINNHTKVTITCPLHGDFTQTPDSHLQKSGCIACSGLKKSTTEEFIKRAREIHGNRYNYDKVKYINNITKVIISCPVHGDFEQVPKSHLKKKGCDSCGGSAKLSTEEFIKRARKIHGDNYNYDKVEYISTKEKVIITCPYHGDFEQCPENHIGLAQKCPRCRISKGENRVESFLKNRQIKYKVQYFFKDCRDRRKLSFDFAIFINDKVGLIEYQGIQHYEQIGFGGDTTNSVFEKSIRRDLVKADYAKTKEIPLLLISYTEFDKIENIIEKFIVENFS